RVQRAEQSSGLILHPLPPAERRRHLVDAVRDRAELLGLVLIESLLVATRRSAPTTWANGVARRRRLYQSPTPSATSTITKITVVWAAAWIALSPTSAASSRMATISGSRAGEGETRASCSR